MPINTEVKGNPDGIRSAADWLHRSLAGGIAQTVDRITSARNKAGAGWEGDAGAAFATRMANGATKADGLETAAVDSARVIDDFAAEIQRAQADMGLIRDEAAAEGLAVEGFLIHEPGPAPPVPGAPPSGSAATPAAVSKYNADVAAYDRYLRLVMVYNLALSASEHPRLREQLAADTVKNMRNDLMNKWFFVAGDMVNGALTGALAGRSSGLLRLSAELADESARSLDLMKLAPPGDPYAGRWKSFESNAPRFLAGNADDMAKAAGDVKSQWRGTGLKIGGALAVGGIAYDIAHGKPVVQAVASGGLGFGASVGAGALIGSAIPVPVLGTAAGVVGGAAVGLVTSGAVDSVFENAAAIGDTIADGAGVVADVVGDGADAVGDVAKDAWNAVF